MATTLAAALGAASAQDQALTVKLAGIHGGGWSHAQAVVTVLDSAGEPVSGLTKSNFTGRINNVDVPVAGLSTGIDSSLPLVVVLAIDTSAGMEGDALAQVKLAAGQFLDGLGPQDSVAVLAFGDTPALVRPFTIDHAAARAAIDGLTAAGGAALYKATEQGILQASAQANSGRRAVVLLSNQADTTPTGSEQALFAAQAMGVPVFAIGLGSIIDHDFLSQLADASAGQFTETTTSQGLVQRFQSVGKVLRDQYVLTLDGSGAGLGASQPATLRVQVTDSGRAGSDERLACAQSVCAGITDVAVGEAVTKIRTVTAQVVSSETVTSVTLLVDGEAVARVTQAPYVFTLKPADFATGDHTLVAEVETAGGATRSSTVDVQFAAVSGAGTRPTVVLLAVAAVAVAVTLSVAFIVWRRRSAPNAPDAPPAPDGPDGPDAPERGRKSPTKESKVRRGGLRLVHRKEQFAAPRQEPEIVLGRLTVAQGPLSGQVFSVGATPVSMGSSQRCQIQFPASPEDDRAGYEYARVWIRDNRLVVHELRRLTAHGVIGGRWELLTADDVFTIGPCSFVVEIASGAGDVPAETSTASTTPHDSVG